MPASKAKRGTASFRTYKNPARGAWKKRGPLRGIIRRGRKKTQTKSRQEVRRHATAQISCLGKNRQFLFQRFVVHSGAVLNCFGPESSDNRRSHDLLMHLQKSLCQRFRVLREFPYRSACWLPIALLLLACAGEALLTWLAFSIDGPANAHPTWRGPTISLQSRARRTQVPTDRPAP